MISNEAEYRRACEELAYLESWLGRLQKTPPTPENGLTRAGVRKMIARIQEELALYEGGMSLAMPRTEDGV